jgi:hypothetical protein
MGSHGNSLSKKASMTTVHSHRERGILFSVLMVRAALGGCKFSNGVVQEGKAP